MKTAAQHSRAMRDQFRILEPEVSAEPGTPERLIFDVVANEIAQLNADRYAQAHTLDFSTKVGVELDDALATFGFSRQAPVRASGRVVFQREQPAPAPIFIPAGSQVEKPATSVTPKIVFQTMVDVVIPQGGTQVIAPIEAVVPGISGNVPAGSITATSFSNTTGGAVGVARVYNPTGTTGGAEGESDADFLHRFRNTNLRNIAGTSDQVLAIAIAASMTTKATVISAQKKHAEYIQIDNSGEATLHNPRSKYVYPENFFLTSTGAESGEIYTPEVDYTFDVDNIAKVATVKALSSVFPAPRVAPEVSPGNDNGSLYGTYQWGYTYLYQNGPNSYGESSLSPIAEASTGDTTTGMYITVPRARDISIDVDGTAASGTFDIEIHYDPDNFSNSDTVTINYDATESDIKTAIVGVLNAEVPDFVAPMLQVTGDLASGSILISFSDDYGPGVPVFEVDDTSLVGATLEIVHPVLERRIYRNAGNGWGHVGTITDPAQMVFIDNELYPGAPPPKSSLTPGAIAYLEYLYLSEGSRNHVSTLVNRWLVNKVDVWLNGQAPATARDVIPVPITDSMDPNNSVLNDTPGNKYYTGNYVRASVGSAGQAPTSGNIFVNTVWAPIISIPSTITIGETVYTEGIDYWLIKDTTINRGSVSARDGIEMTLAMAQAITGSRLVIDYTFNRVPSVIQRVMDRHKQVTQDIMVHEADLRRFNVNLVVMYQSSANREATAAGIRSALGAYFERLSFSDVVQMSDIEAVVHGVPGVDNVRLATDKDDPERYGVEEILMDGSVIIHEEDFILSDTEVAQFNALGPGNGYPIERSQNTWIGGLD